MSTEMGSCQDLRKSIRSTALVCFERYEDIQTAIQREKNMKHWSRAWKVKLILAGNPEWNELHDSIVQ